MQARMSNPVMVIPSAMQALQRPRQGRRSKAACRRRRSNWSHLRASQINGCSVCVDMHARDAEESRVRPTSGSSPSRPGGTRRTSPTPSALPWRSTEAVTRLSDRADPVPDQI